MRNSRVALQKPSVHGNASHIAIHPLIIMWDGKRRQRKSGKVEAEVRAPLRRNAWSLEPLSLSELMRALSGKGKVTSCGPASKRMRMVCFSRVKSRGSQRISFVAPYSTSCPCSLAPLSAITNADSRGSPSLQFRHRHFNLSTPIATIAKYIAA